MALQVNVDQTMDFAERWRMNGIFVSLPPGLKASTRSNMPVVRRIENFCMV
jgi:hypothetical protein